MFTRATVIATDLELAGVALATCEHNADKWPMCDAKCNTCHDGNGVPLGKCRERALRAIRALESARLPA